MASLVGFDPGLTPLALIHLHIPGLVLDSEALF
jgi:hypothetical protein